MLTLRVALRMSQRALAARLGVYHTSVVGWETGRHRPSRLAWSAMRLLAETLGDDGAKTVAAINEVLGPEVE